ncbi:MAG: hypothetical protein LBN25_03860, partial [Christensenellaceae bacterium]|nr:hypothetical protein [Christensenellaceae bacterium]
MRIRKKSRCLVTLTAVLLPVLLFCFSLSAVNAKQNKNAEGAWYDDINFDDINLPDFSDIDWG